MILKKGENHKYFYSDDEEPDMSKFKGWGVTRAKGLGALGDREWEDIYKKPKLIPITEDAGLDEALELMFGKGPNGAERRRDWLST